MTHWFRTRAALWLIPLFLVPVVCAVFFMVDKAPRDWSYHWKAPETLVGSTSSTSVSAVTSPAGWDVLWQRDQSTMVVSHFARDGKRIGSDVTITGSPQATALGRAGTDEAVFWREDIENGSQLRVATLVPGQAPVYRTVARGPWALEHPYAFAAGKDIDVVFSWQRSQYDVYLGRIRPDGSVARPIRLTHAASYAFEPRAVVDAQGDIMLFYLDQCCGGSAYHMVAARFTPAGDPIGTPRRLDLIQSIAGQGNGGTPEQWGLSVARDGPDVWAVWQGDHGFTVARFRDGSPLGPPVPILPVSAPVIALSVAGPYHELTWTEQTDITIALMTISLGPDGLPNAPPDRVAFEAATADNPTPLSGGPVPAVLWQATPSHGVSTRIEASVYSPRKIGPPTVWARLGLGLGSPIGNFLILVVGGFFVGLLLAAGNILLIAGLLLLYLLVFRRLSGPLRWYAYIAAVAVILYLLYVVKDAPNPPIFFMTGISGALGLLAMGGMLVFVWVLMHGFLRRIEDFYRAGILAFASLYFLGFLEAVTIVQSQVGKI